jgi:hypothetical protein
VDKSLGFSIRVPKDWSFAARAKERYIVGTFTCDRDLESIKAKDYREREWHRPMMQIIAFTPENVKAVEENREEALDGVITIVTKRNPYKDFKEYIKRTINGFYFGDEKDDTISKVPCTHLDIIMEQNRPPLRRVACIYHLDDVDIAVFFEIMEEWYPKYERLFNQAFRSFRTVRREIVESAAPEVSKAKTMTREDFIKSKTASLPEGWYHDLTKEHLVISHADKSYTEKVGKFADAIRKVIDKQFKSKGVMKDDEEDEKARMPVLRVCQDRGEYTGFMRGSSTGSFNSDSMEVVVFDGTREGLDIEWMYSEIGQGIFQQYFFDQFKLALPDPWYYYGMSHYYGCFKAKGSRCTYTDNMWITERYLEWLREADRRGECKTLKKLMECNSRNIQSRNDVTKVGTLVSFLNSREGRRKPWRGILDTYLDNFRSAYDELFSKRKKQIKDKTEADKEATEEEEEEGDEEEELKSIIEDFPKEVRKKAFELTFGEWTDEDWERLEKAWHEYTF